MNKKTKHDIDHSEYIRLLMNCQVRVSAYIQSMVQNYQDAEDIFQETASIAWEKFDQYEAGTNFTAWTVQIARNRIMYYWKKKQKSVVCYSDEAVRSIENYVLNASPAMNDQVHLETCFKQMSEKDIRLVRMRYSRKITTKLMAEELGRSLHGLYSTMSRIHIFLAECIRRQRLAEEKY